MRGWSRFRAASRSWRYVISSRLCTKLLPPALLGYRICAR